MALILEPGGQEPARWFRRGAQVGHFILQEIRPGSVVFREGERVQELAVERDAAATTKAVADASSSVDSGPATAAGTIAERPPVLSKRPTRGKSMTVGSARTAPLN